MSPVSRYRAGTDEGEPVPTKVSRYRRNGADLTKRPRFAAHGSPGGTPPKATAKSPDLPRT